MNTPTKTTFTSNQEVAILKTLLSGAIARLCVSDLGWTQNKTAPQRFGEVLKELFDISMVNGSFGEAGADLTPEIVLEWAKLAGVEVGDW